MGAGVGAGCLAGGLMLSFVLVEMAFSQPEIMRRDLDQLIVADELD